ncbi:MAG: hypothetical protein D3906_17350, partial [Candidatus Electrothrix sp. AUS1_2]|nr:hypothetical protein [Candidatus Electrothrix sp. AUS1_2]
KEKIAQKVEEIKQRLAVLASLHQETGNAVIVCLLFHFVQLLIDSILVSSLRASDRSIIVN